VDEHGTPIPAGSVMTNKDPAMENQVIENPEEEVIEV
jgi:hypothetical protein